MQNPYASGRSHQETHRESHSPWRTSLSHLLGLLTFAAGALGWSVLSLIPRAHPAFGGADPLRVLAVVVACAVVCLILALAVIVDATRSRRGLRVVYAIPALGFVAFAIGQIFGLI